MKTYKLTLGLLIAMFITLVACNSTKKKPANEGIECKMIVDDLADETPIPPPAPKETVKFTPPVTTEDCKEMAIITDVVGTDDKVAIDLCELKEHKVVIVENRVIERPFCGNELVGRNYDNTEEYASFVENTFKLATNEPLSTFSVDVDGASYTNIRRFINGGQLPPTDAVRVEEFVNYFKYQYPEPKGNDPVHISTEVGDCPWNKQHRLVKIGLKAKEMPVSELPNSNLVFLIDVSGSMSGSTRIELVKTSMKMLLEQLRPQDRVSIVTYASGVATRLASTPASQKAKIQKVLDGLIASGATSGGDGIIRAYKEAEANFIKGGNNRIILCTDGNFNVGVSSDSELEKLIEKKREGGVFLSVLGYGMGNYKDSKMQRLAQAGNGNHAYIDNIQEAHRVLVQEFGATMFTVAKDVKLQIEFNPAHTQAYRLVGYETRHLNKEDFNDDTKDAGEMGVGHTVIAFYEVVPTGVKSNFVPSVDDLKYQDNDKKKNKVDSKSKEMLTVKLRYKQPDGDVSKKLEKILIDDKGNNVSQDFKFASAVAMYGQLLRGSKYKGDANYEKVTALAKQGLDYDEDGYRREFIRLVESTKSLSN